MRKTRLLLPVELRRVNHGASTNGRNFTVTIIAASWPAKGYLFESTIATHVC